MPICWKRLAGSEKKRGWRPVDHVARHTTAEVGEFDGAETIRYKAYYQCVATVSRCLELTSQLPSCQPIAYYKLLQKGVCVEAGRPAREYQVALREVFREWGVSRSTKKAVEGAYHGLM